MICKFCNHDIYEYVNIGIGIVPVALNCCEMGTLYYGNKLSEAEARRVILEQRRQEGNRYPTRYYRTSDGIFD